MAKNQKMGHKIIIENVEDFLKAPFFFKKNLLLRSSENAAYLGGGRTKGLHICGTFSFRWISGMARLMTATEAQAPGLSWECYTNVPGSCLSRQQMGLQL